MLTYSLPLESWQDLNLHENPFLRGSANLHQPHTDVADEHNLSIGIAITHSLKMRIIIRCFPDPHQVLCHDLLAQVEEKTFIGLPSRT